MLSASRPVEDGVCTALSLFAALALGACSDAQDANNDAAAPGAAVDTSEDPSCDSLYCPPVSFADLPPDAFFAEGVYGQFMFIVPSQDLVVVRLGEDTGGLEHWEEFARGFLGAVLDAIR
jgi:hypothetical protein